MYLYKNREYIPATFHDANTAVCKTSRTKEVRPHDLCEDTPRCPDEPNKEAFNDAHWMTGHVGHPRPPLASHAPQTPMFQTKEPCQIIFLAREKCRNPVFLIFLEQSRTCPGDAPQVRPRDLRSKTLQGARTKEHDAQASSTSSRPLQRKHRRVQNTSGCPDKPNKGAFSDDRRMTHVGLKSTKNAPMKNTVKKQEHCYSYDGYAGCGRTARGGADGA
ncbi:hypothetical protein EVAR_34725_1 [Eumeta japonica]|uniref:Uncharacterized protein n=1 Tax=Eumeta variegata TaxID=151549 RepID=A0A4C1XDI0_EUMVA|nr:hypothetical protein EVAR_34725_1 [Eumeta japonica]